jgi:hypothetical protein
MKPVGDNQASASLLVVGHGLSLAFLCFALHLTATTTRIYYVEMLGHDWLTTLPGAGHLILGADAFLRAQWLWLVPSVVLGLWLDWRLNLRLLRSPNPDLMRRWAYCIFGPLLVLTAMCVGLFRFWTWQLEQPLGGLS